MNKGIIVITNSWLEWIIYPYCLFPSYIWTSLPFTFAVYISLWYKTEYTKQEGKNICFIMEKIYILWKAIVGKNVYTNYIKENRIWNRFMYIFNAPWKKLHIHIFAYLIICIPYYVRKQCGFSSNLRKDIFLPLCIEKDDEFN